MALYTRREKIEALKEWGPLIGSKLSKVGLTPNQWSLLVLLSALVAAYFVLTMQFLLAGIFILLSGFFDIIDGAVARATGKVTKEGAYIDTIVDRYSEFLFVIPFTLIALPNFFLPAQFWLFLYLFGGLATTYAKAAAKERELVKTELKGGILERAERVSLFAIGTFLASFDLIYFVPIVAALALLSNISALQRIYAALRTRA